MTKIGLLMVGCVGIVAAPGCVADAPAADGDQTQVTEAETAAPPEAASPNAIGQFHLLRVANTQLCLQPQGGSTGDVIVELRPCVASAPAQNWLFSQKGSSDWEIINAQSGKCLYNGSAVPQVDGGQPITHEGCNVFGTNVPASNALWKPSSLTNFSSLQSRIQHRDSGFCLDVPGANPFDGATMQMWHCNGTPAQIWVVGVE